jgi:hypothetical protein
MCCRDTLQTYISHCFVTPGCVLFALCCGVLRHVMAILQVLPACFLGVLCQIAAVLQEQGGAAMAPGAVCSQAVVHTVQRCAVSCCNLSCLSRRCCRHVPGCVVSDSSSFTRARGGSNGTRGCVVSNHCSRCAVLLKHMSCNIHVHVIDVMMTRQLCYAVSCCAAL